MKIYRIMAMIGLWLNTHNITAQHDRNYVIGYPCVQVRYDSDSVRQFKMSNKIYHNSSLASISDEFGILKIVFNGNAIYGANGDTIPNGKNLGDSFITHYQDEPWFQEAIVLPKTSNQYYAISYSVSDSLLNATAPNYPYPDNLYYAVVDMSANGGKGKVLSKKNVIYHGPQGDSRLTACLHANGRDWWLVNHGYCNNQYNIYLCTPDTIIPWAIQHLGISTCKPDYIGQAVFSPDGTKYATCNADDSLISLFHFDRCSGIFSNPQAILVRPDTIHFPKDTLTYYYYDKISGVAFSPSGRFLYASAGARMKQFDLLASDITNSQFALYHANFQKGPNYHVTGNMFLVPSGQILIDNYQAATHTKMGIIEFPDLPDSSCHFVRYGYTLIDSTIDPEGISNMPTTFRLGALKGSGCDTISTGINDIPQSKIVVSPNPAHTTLSVSLRQYERDAMLYIYDALGREMYSNRHFYLDDYINVKNFPVGVYYLRIQTTNGEYCSKFIKE